ncbi:MAG: hypothetical protein Q7V88_10700 [Actinomycetota bacterium]|nr:hypothetical protein [Actinomycetota bacterium]
MLRDAQRGFPLQRIWDSVDQTTLGQEMAYCRGQLQAIQTYLVEARSVLAQSGPAITNFLRTTYQSGVQIVQVTGQFLAQHEAEVQAGGSGVMAAAGGAIQYTVGGSAAAAATAGTAAAGTAAAGGVVAETLAGGVVAAETVAAATAAEGTVGATLATGAAGGSWLGPMGIAIGLAIAGLVAGGVYVYTHSGSNRPATVATETAPSGPPGADLFTCPQTIDGWTLDTSLSGLHDLEHGKYSFSCSYDYMLGFQATWYEAPASASCPIDDLVNGPSGMGGNIVSTTKPALAQYTSDSAGYTVSAPSMKDHAQELLAVVEARAAPCPP